MHCILVIIIIILSPPLDSARDCLRDPDHRPVIRFKFWGPDDIFESGEDTNILKLARKLIAC